MAGILEYKCPACGGAIHFEAGSRKMKCPFCDSEIDIAEVDPGAAAEAGAENSGPADAGAAGASESPASSVQTSPAGVSLEDGCQAMSSDWNAGEVAELQVFSCNSCGGEIILGATEAAGSCPFCDNNLVVPKQFEGGLKPDLVIPFKKSKEDARAAYTRHLQNRKYIPAVFRQKKHIEDIRGIYVPVWLFDADADARADFETTREKSWNQGDERFTEKEIYQCQRAGSMQFRNVPVDASTHVDSSLLESIEPYNAKDSEPFKMAFLAGYGAERYDVSMENSIHRARERMEASAETALRKTVDGDSRVIQSDVSIYNASYRYALYPLWILNTKWNDKWYTFAMNGQTGKMAGDIPYDSGSFWKSVVLRGLGIAAVLYAGMWAFTLLF